MLLQADRSQLLVVDMQERLLPAMCEPAAAQGACERLLRAAAVLNLPVIASQQYPRGLGQTVPAIAELVPEGGSMDKVHFACSGDPEIMARLTANDRPQVVICGIEAHVCVLQTAVSLQQRGYEPAVVMDAVSSRRPESVALAEARLLANDVEVINSEMAIFEWMGQAGTPAFKELSALIK